MYRREQTRPVTGRRNWEEFFLQILIGLKKKRENVIKLPSGVAVRGSRFVLFFGGFRDSNLIGRLNRNESSAREPSIIGAQKTEKWRPEFSKKKK